MKKNRINTAFKRFLNYLSTSRRFEGGLLLNIMGYQLFRIFLFQTAFRLRRKPHVSLSASQTEALRELEEKGVVVLTDFFAPDIFQKIKEETEKLDLTVYNERFPHMLKGERLKQSGAHSNVLHTYFAQNNFINSIISAALRKEILVEPGIVFDRVYVAPEDYAAPSTETADNLHFDMSFPTIKCFFYVHDVDERNAAFQYVRSSHKMSIKRMLQEYRMSISFWLGSKEEQETVTPTVPDEHVNDIGLQIESITGKANTLVIANTMGYHRRGRFTTTTSRDQICVNYRSLSTLSYVKKKVLSLLTPSAASLKTTQTPYPEV